MISTTPLPKDDAWPNNFQIGDAVKLKDIPLNTTNETIMDYFKDSPVKYISELVTGAITGNGCFVSLTSTPGGQTETRGWVYERFARVSKPPKKVKDVDISNLLGL
jgi:hypothetical protein